MGFNFDQIRLISHGNLRNQSGFVLQCADYCHKSELFETYFRNNGCLLKSVFAQKYILANTLHCILHPTIKFYSHEPGRLASLSTLN